MKFHISRWHYWYGYLLVLVLVGLAIWFSDRAMDYYSWIAGIVCLVLFVFLEFLICSERIVLEGEHVEFRKGVFSKDSTRVSCKSVSNVSVSQSLVQRLLRYGDVEVRTSGGDYVLNGFEEPAKIERLLSAHLKHGVKK